MHAKAGEPPSPQHSLLVVVVVVVVAGVLFGLELVAIGNLVSNSVLKVWCYLMPRVPPPPLTLAMVWCTRSHPCNITPRVLCPAPSLIPSSPSACGTCWVALCSLWCATLWTTSSSHRGASTSTTLRACLPHMLTPLSVVPLRCVTLCSSLCCCFLSLLFSQ